MGFSLIKSDIVQYSTESVGRHHSLNIEPYLCAWHIHPLLVTGRERSKQSASLSPESFCMITKRVRFSWTTQSHISQQTKKKKKTLFGGVWERRRGKWVTESHAAGALSFFLYMVRSSSDQPTSCISMMEWNVSCFWPVSLPSQFSLRTDFIMLSIVHQFQRQISIVWCRDPSSPLLKFLLFLFLFS